MKFLLLSLFLVCAYIPLSVWSQTQTNVQRVRDQLLARARYLTELVEGEVKLLRFENHTLAAEGLTAELERLITVELELRATASENATQAYVVRLEEQLNAIEERIRSQLAALGTQFVSRREIQELLRITQQLLNRTGEEIKTLKAQNKTIEAAALQREEERIIQLEVDLRSTQNSSQIRRYEELLVEIEYRVVELINGLLKNSTTVLLRKRDLRDDLIANATSLLSLANAEIAVLQSQNRTQAMALIQREVQQIETLIAELKNATTNASITRLETQLRTRDIQLNADLARLGRGSVAQQKEALINSTQDLLSRAALELANLYAENRTNQAETLKTIVTNITNLITEIRAATTLQQVITLGQTLNQTEDALVAELQRIGQPTVTRDVRQVLIRRAEELSIRVTIEIRVLVDSNRSLEAEGLRAEERNLIALDVELRNAITQQEIQTLEQRLTRLEEVIAQQLRALNTTTTKYALRDDVLKRAQELLTIANSSVTAFQSQNRTQAVTLIQSIETELLALVKELQANTNESQIGALEGRVVAIEYRLAEDLRRLGRPVDVNERKDLLLTRADALQRWANAAVNATRNANRTVEIARIEAQETVIINLISQLKNATTDAELSRIETSLSQAENTLVAELRAIGQPLITREEVVALETRAEELAIRIIIEVRSLVASGRGLLAEGLREEERALIVLDAELRTAVTPQQIATIEQRLQTTENRVAQELARIAGTLLFAFF